MALLTVRRQLAAGAEVPAVSMGQSQVHVVLIGSHMGSNMEPLSMVEACFQKAGTSLKSTVLGTTYPFPEIMCESFGHCARNPFIDDAVRLLVQQMSLGTNKIGATIVLLLVR